MWVYSNPKKGGEGRDEAKRIYIPFSTLQASFNAPNRLDWYTMSIKPGIEVKLVEKKVKRALALKHNASPDDEQAIGSWNAQEEFRSFQGLFAAIRIFIWIVGIGTIIAGIVGVSNIMLIIVKERTREIGVRKAIGATPWSIISLIIQESVVITAVAGYAGLVFGVVVIEAVRITMEKTAMENEFFSNPNVDFNAAVTATVLLVISGTLAGFIPARKAAAIQPIQALQSE